MLVFELVVVVEKVTDTVLVFELVVVAEKVTDPVLVFDVVVVADDDLDTVLVLELVGVDVTDTLGDVEYDGDPLKELISELVGNVDRDPFSDEDSLYDWLGELDTDSEEVSEYDNVFNELDVPLEDLLDTNELVWVTLTVLVIPVGNVVGDTVNVDKVVFVTVTDTDFDLIFVFEFVDDIVFVLDARGVVVVVAVLITVKELIIDIDVVTLELAVLDGSEDLVFVTDTVLVFEFEELPDIDGDDVDDLDSLDDTEFKEDNVSVGVPVNEFITDNVGNEFCVLVIDTVPVNVFLIPLDVIVTDPLCVLVDVIVLDEVGLVVTVFVLIIEKLIVPDVVEVFELLIDLVNVGDDDDVFELNLVIVWVGELLADLLWILEEVTVLVGFDVAVIVPDPDDVFVDEIVLVPDGEPVDVFDELTVLVTVAVFLIVKVIFELALYEGDADEVLDAPIVFVVVPEDDDVLVIGGDRELVGDADCVLDILELDELVFVDVIVFVDDGDDVVVFVVIELIVFIGDDDDVLLSNADFVNGFVLIDVIDVNAVGVVREDGREVCVLADVLVDVFEDVGDDVGIT